MDETSATALSNDASVPWRRELEMRWKRREVMREVNETEMKLEGHQTLKGQTEVKRSRTKDDAVTGERQSWE